MGQFIITGDRAAGLDAIERLLRRSGMSAAVPAGPDGRLPPAINLALRRGHEISDRHEDRPGLALAQIQVETPWHALALEGLIANQSQPLWGWSDAKAVPLLDYWRQVDPGARFVLVYAAPDSVLEDLDPTESASQLETRLSRWQRVNEALLGFHLRHPQRCLLVHSGQVRRSVGPWARALRSKFPARWSDRLQRMADYGGASDEGAPARSEALSWLRTQVLQAFPAALQLYEELQCSACLPLESAEPLTATAASLQLWQTVDRQGRRLEAAEREQVRSSEQLREAQAVHQALTKQVEAQARALAVCATEDEAKSARVQALTAQLAHSEAVAVEVPHLIQQLQGVQEAMALTREEAAAAREALVTAQEELGLVRESLRERDADLLDVRTRHAESEARRVALEAELAQGAAQQADWSAARAQAEALRRENDALLAQLQSVQEALERACTQPPSAGPPTTHATTSSPALSGAAPVVSPKPLPIDSLSARHAPLGAAERVRSQLSYRLGSCMIECSRTPLGWITMPFRLMSISLSFRRERIQRRDRKLLPIHAYRDAHEADRMRQHLSYRLGHTLIQQLSRPAGWVALPFALYREVGHFRSASRG